MYTVNIAYLKVSLYELFRLQESGSAAINIVVAVVHKKIFI